MKLWYHILVMLPDGEHTYFSHPSEEAAFTHAEALEKTGSVIRRVWMHVDRDLTSSYRGRSPSPTVEKL